MDLARSPGGLTVPERGCTPERGGAVCSVRNASALAISVKSYQGHGEVPDMVNGPNTVAALTPVITNPSSSVGTAPILTSMNELAPPASLTVSRMVYVPGADAVNVVFAARGFSKRPAEGPDTCCQENFRPASSLLLKL